MAQIDLSKLSSEVKEKYQIRDNTFFLTPKDDWKDRIQIEVGDNKDETTVQPQVKLMRWDNEVNFSARLKDFADYTVSTEGEKIKLTNHTKEVNLYDLAEGEGGYEFEVILKEKPVTNKIEFTLQDKDVEYFYQPELTQQEKDQGASRPDNVIGSYAVYVKTPKTNWIGGKEYKCGKVGHIFRPKIIDSVGTEVWGDLHIEKGTLSVTIPQEFLDKAIYPVRHAAGLTFGYVLVGVSSMSADDNFWFGSLVTTTGAITPLSLTCIGNDGGNSYFKGIIVQHSDLTIIANGVGNQSDLMNGYVSVSSFSTPPTMNASTEYIISCVFDEGTSLTIAYDDGAANTGHYETDNSYSTPTNPTSITHGTEVFSMYVVYSTANCFPTTSTDDSGFSYTAGTALSYAGGNNVRIGYRSGVNYGDIVSAFRFQNVTIPKGSVITSATFTYAAYDTDASTDTVTLYAEDVDNSPAITETGDEEPKDKGTRVTTASVNWTLPNQVAGSSYTSGEIKTIINEITDRASWSSGNAITIVIKNNGASENHNALGGLYNTYLTITYETTSVSPDFFNFFI